MEKTNDTITKGIQKSLALLIVSGTLIVVAITSYHQNENNISPMKAHPPEKQLLTDEQPPAPIPGDTQTTPEMTESSIPDTLPLELNESLSATPTEQAESAPSHDTPVPEKETPEESLPPTIKPQEDQGTIIF